MSEGQVEVTRSTSVQLLDAAIWREIGSEEPQPAPAFLEALSTLLGRWLLVRSAAPEMDAVTVLCKARGYIARHGRASGDADLQDENGKPKTKLQHDATAGK